MVTALIHIQSKLCIWFGCGLNWSWGKSHECSVDLFFSPPRWQLQSIQHQELYGQIKFHLDLTPNAHLQDSLWGLACWVNSVASKENKISQSLDSIPDCLLHLHFCIQGLCRKTSQCTFKHLPDQSRNFPNLPLATDHHHQYHNEVVRFTKSMSAISCAPIWLRVKCWVISEMWPPNNNATDS